ncbi:MAG: NAD(+) synthase [Rikenellaceae bacterium]
MKIALAQLNYTVGDIEGNTFKIIDSIQRAKREGANLVVFAEQSVSGLPAYELLRKNTFLELCEDALVQIASECDNISALVGLPLLTDHGTVSAAALIQNRKVLRYIGKRDITARREMGFLSASTGYEYATIGGHKLAIVVGDDLSRLRDFDNSIETIISLNARKYGRATLARRYDTARHIAYVENKNIVMVNQVGGGADIVYDGTSCVFNKRGEHTLIMKSFEEDFQIYDLGIDHKGESRAPYESYNIRPKLLFEAARLGLKDFFYKSGYQKACLGLSGGIDSSVVASIAVAALGKENVMGLILPSDFSDQSSIDDAVELARNLGIDYNIIPITDTYTSIIDTLSPIIGGTEFDATEENIVSRIRTTILMALQNKRGHILLNSTNKSENALGLCTLYGDTAGAISVTGDLYKNEIYAIAKHINKIMDRPIPEAILNKEPTSELLRPDRRDAQQLPSYEVVDAIVFRMIEKRQHREEILNAGFDLHDVELIHKMIMQSEKKRFQCPPVLRLSSCSFGHEWFMPLTHKYGD